MRSSIFRNTKVHCYIHAGLHNLRLGILRSEGSCQHLGMPIYKTWRGWNEILLQSIFHTTGVQFGVRPCSGGQWSWLIKIANDNGTSVYSPVISLAPGDDIRPLSSWATLLKVTSSNIINEAFVQLAQGSIIENFVDINHSNWFWYSPVKL